MQLERRSNRFRRDPAIERAAQARAQLAARLDAGAQHSLPG